MSNDFSNMNPYQSTPSATGAMPSGPVNKPTSVTVFGILNVVFGALGLLGLIFVVVSLFLDLPKDPNNPMQAIMDDPTYKIINIGLQVVGTIMAVLLLASGIGLVNGQAYGRRLAIYYAIGAMLFVLIGTAINVAFISMPAFAKASELPDGPEKIAAIAGGSAIFAQPICGLIYPVLLLIFMMRAPVKNYFRVQ